MKHLIASPLASRSGLTQTVLTLYPAQDIANFMKTISENALENHHHFTNDFIQVLLFELKTTILTQRDRYLEIYRSDKK